MSLTTIAAASRGGDVDAPVRFSHAHGLYDRPFELSLSTSGAGAIYYTTDGSDAGSETARPFKGPIGISSTTVLRAWVRAGDGTETACTTRTFVFPNDVGRQRGAGLPQTWGEKDGKPVPAYYDVRVADADDPDHVELERALRSIPTLSLVLGPSDLFGKESGIYSHPEEKGKPWERRASVEYIDPAGGAGFQKDCGVRVHGGWARRPEESPKHAFRLLFRPRDPSGPLDFPPFGDGGGETRFTNLVLRGGNNNTFLHPSSEERRRAEYVRDQWMRDTHAAMGHPAARGLFVHLYLDGLYWGVYNLTERPDADFAAATIGGDKKDYDSRRADKVLEGDKDAWEELLAAAESGVGRPDEYEKVARLLDVPAFADFMILNLYGANGDWDGSSNWYAARDRRRGGRFQFFVWDGERTLESVDADVVAYDAPGSPSRLFQTLRRNGEFRVAFADRVQKHLCGAGGTLAPAAAARRYRAWSDVLDPAIVGEAARWGSYRRDVHPFRIGPYEQYSRAAHFRPEVDRLLRAYFPRRTDVVLRQFRGAGLYPATEPPEVRREGRRVYLDAAKDQSIHFTTDGTDPRLAGGKVAPTATRYTEPVSVAESQTLKARALAPPGEGGGEWSALVEAAGPSSSSAP